MISIFKKSACLFFAAAAVFTLSGCVKAEGPTATVPTEIITLPTAPIAEETVPETDPRELVEELAVVLEAGELYTLEHYPNLKAVDLRGSTCYDAIVAYMEKHPEIKVTYSVDLGGTVVPQDATEATLKPGSFSYDSLLENLQYLPGMTAVNLPDVELSPEQIDALVEAYPGIALNYTVQLLGSSYDSSVTELDLSAMEASQVAECAGKLGLLTNVTRVSLSSSLSKEDVDALQDACPDVVFDYSFSLFGKTISTADTEVVYKKHDIGNEGEAELRKALDIMDSCQRFVLEDCGIDYEVLAKIREDYREGPKVVWRVYFGVGNRYSFMTDVDTLRAVYNVTDDTCGNMKYCEDVKYMDIGHNEYLTDLSFVGYMPNIEVLIASGCAVKELVGFENCKKLTWLELASCLKLENIDSLSGCESLRFLNLCYTKVKSYEALDTLPLERFICLSPKASTEEQNTFMEIHGKGCRTVFYGYNNPWTAWRYDDNGKTFNAYYKDVVRKAFNYDYLETLLPKD